MAGCVNYQKSIADRNSRQIKLVPMPTGKYPFKEIAMDFVKELPESEGINTILVLWIALPKYSMIFLRIYLVQQQTLQMPTSARFRDTIVYQD